MIIPPLYFFPAQQAHILFPKTIPLRPSALRAAGQLIVCVGSKTRELHLPSAEEGAKGVPA